jgi:plasmid stability protein
VERLDEKIFINIAAGDKERLRLLAVADGRSLANEARRLILAGLKAKPEPGKPALNILRRNTAFSGVEGRQIQSPDEASTRTAA